MPKPVSRFDVEAPSGALSKKRKQWVCPECYSIHLDFKRDRCLNEKCIVYKVEGLYSVSEEDYAEIRKEEIARRKNKTTVKGRSKKPKTKLRDVRLHRLRGNR